MPDGLMDCANGRKYEERQSRQARETHPTDRWVDGHKLKEKDKESAREKGQGEQPGSQTDKQMDTGRCKKERKNTDRQTDGQMFNIAYV